MSIYEPDDFHKTTDPGFMEEQKRLTIEKNRRIQQKRREEILALQKSYWTEEENRAYKCLEAIEEDIKHLSIFKPHPSHDELIALGDQIVPFLIKLVKDNNPNEIPAVWYLLSALREITGADPVKMDHLGRLNLIIQDWLEWSNAQDGL